MQTTLQLLPEIKSRAGTARTIRDGAGILVLTREPSFLAISASKKRALFEQTTSGSIKCENVNQRGGISCDLAHSPRTRLEMKFLEKMAVPKWRGRQEAMRNDAQILAKLVHGEYREVPYADLLCAHETLGTGFIPRALALWIGVGAVCGSRDIHAVKSSPANPAMGLANYAELERWARGSNQSELADAIRRPKEAMCGKKEVGSQSSRHALKASELQSRERAPDEGDHQPPLFSSRPKGPEISPVDPGSLFWEAELNGAFR
mmetsp:Transcript_65843/g.148567  ORF Transcript_65843/g.148567 Transcript_65843/m.148567 type:complete len:262 (+) Transcript_65843:25-810(+)